MLSKNVKPGISRNLYIYWIRAITISLRYFMNALKSLVFREIPEMKSSYFIKLIFEVATFHTVTFVNTAPTLYTLRVKVWMESAVAIEAQRPKGTKQKLSFYKYSHCNFRAGQKGSHVGRQKRTRYFAFPQQQGKWSPVFSPVTIFQMKGCITC